MAEEVKLYGSWVSPYSRRIELALKLKRIPFEYIEEDMSNTSLEILKYNPVYKKVPVIVHNGKPISESLVILEYIDETWKSNPILPQDPYQKAMARFWAKFIDETILPTAQKVNFGEGKERELAIEEISRQMKILENELSGKDFFGGETIGLVDIAAIVLAFWFLVTQEILGEKSFTPEKFPVLYKWIGKLQEIDVVNESRPPRQKHIAAIRAHFQGLKSSLK